MIPEARAFVLLLFAAICVIAAVGLAIRLSTPHVNQGRMTLLVVLAVVLYTMVKTCSTALAILAM